MDHTHHQMNHNNHESAMTDPNMAQFMEKDMRHRFILSFLFTIPILIVTYFLPPSFIIKNWILLILTTPIVFKFGSIFPIGAYQALKNKTLNMMVLIATGVMAAYIFSVIITLFTDGETFFEAAAMLVTFVLFGHWMEMKSRRGTSDALRALFDLVPPQARVLRNNQELTIPTAEVLINDILIIKPGDKIPVDGQVVEGESSIDESLVTGESIPIEKKVGDQVIGGSINQNGSFKFKATKIGSDTALAQIVKLVETAQNSKAPGQRIADKAAQYLVILAIGSGLLTFIIWFFILNQPLLFALTFAISAVVIACPDALGLATPTAVAVGTGLGAKHNILIKDATTLEQVSKINAIVLDKTGTITEGKPVVTQIYVAPGFVKNDILKYFAAIESKSNHPLASAIINYVNNQKIIYTNQKITDFRSISGYGVSANIDGKSILVGNLSLFTTEKINIKSIETSIQKLLDSGNTIMVMSTNNTVSGVIGITDPIKKTSAIAIKKLQEIGIEVFMVTGDNQTTALIVGQKVGLDNNHIFSEVLPEDKSKYVKKLQQQNKFVAMVGDGVNDAPALAQADIGIAIGAGTDVAIETANVVLMKSDPADIVRAIRLSQATVRKMKENLIWASVYNVLAIPIAAGVLYPSLGLTLRPEFSALLMSISSIIVATNAVLLKRAEKSLLTV